MKLNTYFNILGFFFLFLFSIFIIDAFINSFGLMLYRFYPNSILSLFSNFYYLGPGVDLLNNGHSIDYSKLRPAFSPLIWDENGLVELLQSIFLIISIFILVNIFYNLPKNKNKIIIIFVFLEIIGLTYFFLEEISYGQHFFNFKTPDILININNQKEFNLHNISNLFNELPKSLVKIWCGLSIILYMIIKPKINPSYSNIIIPNKKLIYISFFVLIFTIPDLIVSKFDLLDYSKIMIKLEHFVAPIFDHCGWKIGCLFIGYEKKSFYALILSSNFFRVSELQEFLFAYYFFWHTLFLKKSILNGKNSNYNF